jgi:hypothetical protein
VMWAMCEALRAWFPCVGFEPLNGGAGRSFPSVGAVAGLLSLSQPASQPVSQHVQWDCRQGLHLMNTVPRTTISWVQGLKGACA